uniref:Ixodegrin B n=1 Tax=Rhipicephalus zambeziensis TaxID=60191 RepID=A0A224YD67_9ACAR
MLSSRTTEVLLIYFIIVNMAFESNSLSSPEDLCWSDPRPGRARWAAVQLFTKRRGEYCKNSDECQKHLCCIYLNSTCQPKARLGEDCSDDQVKSGCYTPRCPCDSGQGFCENNICV